MQRKLSFLKKRSIPLFTLFIVIVFSAMPVSGKSSRGMPCTSTLASYKGVPARSNGMYPYSSCRGNSIYGLQYQCVEYVRRFYHRIMKIETRDGFAGKLWDGNAKDYFKTADSKGLNAFKNGGVIAPRPDDIIVFKGGPYGHVAIITSVSDGHIEIIQQNFSQHGTGILPYDPATHTVIGPKVSGGRLSTEGWLRPKLQA